MLFHAGLSSPSCIARHVPSLVLFFYKNLIKLKLGFSLEKFRQTGTKRELSVALDTVLYLNMPPAEDPGTFCAHSKLIPELGVGVDAYAC